MTKREKALAKLVKKLRKAEAKYPGLLADVTLESLAGMVA